MTPLKIGQIWLGYDQNVRWTVVRFAKRTELSYQTDLSYQWCTSVDRDTHKWTGDVRWVSGVWSRATHGIDPYALTTLIYDPPTT
jgi:hypothetical protein